MGQFDQKEDYLELLKDQIRCKKAKALVAEEMDHHIEDQKASYMEGGIEENAAMVMALEQMGNPIEVGKQLNNIHKPRMDRHLLLAVLALCCLGVFAQFSINKSMDDSMLSNSISVGRHILLITVGFLLMITVYFLDYSIIGKYPKAIWSLLLAGFFLYAPFAPRVNGQIHYLYAYGMLLIPVYGGILYAYRKKGYPGIIKCLLFGMIASMIELRFVVQSSVYLGLILSSLIMLSTAAMKNWFGISKRKAMVIIWGWLPIAIAYLTLTFSGSRIFRPYQIDRLQSMFETILHPELYAKGYQMNAVRQVLSHVKLIGGSTGFTIGYLPSLNNDYILTYVIGKWGIGVGMLLIGLLITFIGRMIYISFKQKNPLGMFVGLGCSLVFAVQGSIYILSNLGFSLIAQVNLPFVSYGGSSLFINFIILGIMLSVFRNTNVLKEVPYKPLKKKYEIHIERIK